MDRGSSKVQAAIKRKRALFFRVLYDLERAKQNDLQNTYAKRDDMKMDRKKITEGLKNLLFWLSRGIGRPLLCPEVIQIPLTNACNLKCSMCSIHSASKAELSKEVIFDLLRQASDMGIKEVVLTGGEPLLRRDLFEICDDCKSKQLRAIVTTNGTLIDDALAQAIVSSGLSHIHFSLDGMEETNNLVRGKGNFSKAVQGIMLLDKLRKSQRRDLSIGIACTVMGHNLEDLPRLVEYADSLNVDVINFQPLLKDNANTPDRNESEFWVLEKKWPLLDAAIEKIKSFKGQHIHIYEEPDLRLFGKYYRKNLSASDWKCFGGYKTIFVCVGDSGAPLLYTCDGICGNLAERTLKECWASREANKLRQAVKKCKNPCLQSCYSRKNSESFASICRGFFDHP
jgi:MoaA/NifB/PqqE/SkfB family radical SAM enzyme